MKQVVLKSFKEITKQTRNLGNNLQLRRFQLNDADQLFLLTDRNRNYLKNWLPWLHYCTISKDSLNFINMSNEDIAKNSSITYGMFNKNNLMGVIGFHKVDWENNQAGVGYWIGKEFQGQGYVTLACQELIKIGFKEIGLKKLLLAVQLKMIKAKQYP